MTHSWKRVLLVVLAAGVFLLLVFAGAVVWWYQRVKQVADPKFDTRVERPAYTEQHPKVLFDEAHHNFHTASGRYRPFADLISHDGYRIAPNQEKFEPQTLASYDILVIANALGAWMPILPGAGKPAFTEAECDAVRDWVRAGGALLLIADHEPFGAAAANLARRFQVQMSRGWTYDESNFERQSQNPEWLVFSRENGLLADHPITQGREADEGINRVVAFTGQSLKGPEGSAAFLRLADTAVDLSPDGQETPATGRSVGVALEFGQGRVVVLGEAAMLSAQLAGPQRAQFGMNRPGNDNRQLALNIMHWLSRALN